MIVDLFLQTLVSTITQGSILALISIGMTLVYGTLRVLNMAQGAMVMLGGFAAFTTLQLAQVPIWVALAVAILVTFVLGVVTYFVAVKPLLGRVGVDFEMTAFISTFAAATIIQNVVLLVYGPRQKPFDPVIPGLVQITGTVSITWHAILMNVVAIGSLAVLGLFLARSRYGLAITAVAQNLEAARLMGIPARRVYAVTMGIGAALAGIAGVLLAPIYFVYPNAGDLPLLQSLIVVIFAGLGSVRGTIYAAYIIGFIQSAVSIYWGTAYALPVLYIIILVVLVIRPYGLAGKPQEARL
ncbi:MAG: branched-chain amino acid ABC transporter permease [Candidatus Nanopelagicales bacterium]